MTKPKQKDIKHIQNFKGLIRLWYQEDLTLYESRLYPTDAQLTFLAKLTLNFSELVEPFGVTTGHLYDSGYLLETKDVFKAIKTYKSSSDLIESFLAFNAMIPVYREVPSVGLYLELEQPLKQILTYFKVPGALKLKRQLRALVSDEAWEQHQRKKENQAEEKRLRLARLQWQKQTLNPAHLFSVEISLPYSHAANRLMRAEEGTSDSFIKELTPSQESYLWSVYARLIAWLNHLTGMQVEHPKLPTDLFQSLNVKEASRLISCFEMALESLADGLKLSEGDKPSELSLEPEGIMTEELLDYLAVLSDCAPFVSTYLPTLELLESTTPNGRKRSFGDLLAFLEVFNAGTKRLLMTQMPLNTEAPALLARYAVSEWLTFLVEDVFETAPESDWPLVDTYQLRQDFMTKNALSARYSIRLEAAALDEFIEPHLDELLRRLEAKR